MIERREEKLSTVVTPHILQNKVSNAAMIERACGGKLNEERPQIDNENFFANLTPTFSGIGGLGVALNGKQARNRAESGMLCLVSQPEIQKDSSSIKNQLGTSTNPPPNFGQLQKDSASASMTPIVKNSTINYNILP